MASSLLAPARAQSAAAKETAISVSNTEGPLLRVVSEKAAEPSPVKAGGKSDVKRVPLAQADSLPKAESDEPPKPTPAPSTPVKRQAIGPEMPSAKTETEDDFAKKPEEAQAPVPPEQISAARSKLLIDLNNQEGAIDLTPIVKDLPQNEDPIISEEMRIDEAVAFALKNNFEIAAAKHNAYSKRWEEVASAGQYLPKAEYSKGTGRQRSTPASYKIDNQRVKDSTHHYRERVWSASQPIIDLTLISDLLSRHQTASAAEADEESLRETIALETMQAYYELIQYSLLLRFAETYKQQLESLNTRMQARVEGGGAPQAELDRINARSLNAQASILESTQGFERTVYTLRRLIGVTPGKIAIPANFLPFVPPDVEEIVRKSVSGNPAYLSAVHKANAAQYDAATAFGASLPKLSFEVSSTRTYNAGNSSQDFTVTDGGPFAYQTDRKALLVLSWAFTPFVDLPQTAAGVSRARSEFYKSIDIRKKVEEAIRMSFSALRSATARIDAVQQSMASSVKVVEAFEAQYQSANRTMLDLLDAYERLYQTRAELVKIMVSEAEAGYRLRRQMGELVHALAVIEDRDPDVIMPPMPALKNGND